MSAVFHGTTNLLERLAEKAGCAYLSDLHAEEWAGRLQIALEEVGPEQAGLEEWNEAARYITGAKRQYPSAEQARDQLLAHVKKERPI